VFLIDREAVGAPGTDYVTFIGSNFVEEGQRAGDWVVKNTNGKAGVIILEGTAGASVARDRNQGFMDAIKNSPDIKILASQPADFVRANGQKVMENLIQAHGKNITVVYAHNDEMALGAIQALKSANMNPGKDVLVVSVDGQKSALEAITAGEMNVTRSFAAASRYHRRSSFRTNSLTARMPRSLWPKLTNPRKEQAQCPTKRSFR
jgi:ribose transport system substrate-binding protein